MKYHNLHDFRTSTAFKEKFSDHFRDRRKLKLTSFLGGVINYALNILFVIPPGDDVILTSKFARSFSL